MYTMYVYNWVLDCACIYNVCDQVFCPTGGGGIVGREFMCLMGVDCGPPRLPLLPMNPEAVKNLESDLTDMGFFDWA